jgi:phage gp36-like protein
MACFLNAGEDNSIYAAGLQDEFGIFIDNAVCSFDVRDPQGALLLEDITMSFIENGTYRGVLLNSQLPVVDGVEYVIVVEFEWLDQEGVAHSGRIATSYFGRVSAGSSGVNVYATCKDLTILFGRDNINKWADLNNNGDEDEIEERKIWSLRIASRRIDDRLRGGPYLVPFALPYPESLVDATAKLAGVILYEGPRGLSDTDEGDHALIGYKNEVQVWLASALNGRVRFRGVSSTRTPDVVT